MSTHRSPVRPFLRLAPVLLLAVACRGGHEPPPPYGLSASTPPSAPAAGPETATLSRNDAVLLASAKVALPPAGFGPADLPEPHSAGAILLAQFCDQCHALPSPAMHSATDWPRVPRRMWLRMELLPDSLGIRTPAEGDRGIVLDYLVANALSVSGSELPAGAGREDFALVCSRCHALPDVRLHTSGDWPAVFLRMERNMERMNVARPTPQQTNDILLYLQDVATR